MTISSNFGLKIQELYNFAGIETFIFLQTMPGIEIQALVV